MLGWESNSADLQDALAYSLNITTEDSIEQ